MNQLEMYCVTNKEIKFLEKSPYRLAAVGLNSFSESYLKCNNKINIFYKEKNYSELTFHYWYWKNMLNLHSKSWIGFCQRRRFWIKNASEKFNINKNNLKDHMLITPESDWSSYESIVCKPIKVSGAKKIKILKRGWKNILTDPSLLFDESRQNIKLHFDMHHGYGNLDLAIEQLDLEDRYDFSKFVRINNKFNPHIMFISKPFILNSWFATLFAWLERCEKKIPQDQLMGYDKTRMYAYLAERFLSYWFQKYTKYKEQSWIFIDD